MSNFFGTLRDESRFTLCLRPNGFSVVPQRRNQVIIYKTRFSENLWNVKF